MFRPLLVIIRSTANTTKKYFTCMMNVGCHKRIHTSIRNIDQTKTLMKLKTFIFLKLISIS
jgi:hypothetical protein